MKKILLFVFSALALFNLSSCFEDEGNYDYIDLPRFLVDTTGVNMSMTVTQFEQLSVPSRLVYDGNKSDLDFYWVVYEAGTYGENISDTIATTENFNQPVTFSPGSYLLEFLAVVKETGRRSSMQYNLTVESAVGSGLLVFYKKGNECDVDIVKTKTLIGSLTEEKIVRNIYSRVEDNLKLTGTPLVIDHASGLGHIELYTDTEAAWVSPDDMGKMAEFNTMFWDTPATCKPQGYVRQNNSQILFVNDGEVFYLNGNGFYNDNPVILFPGGVATPGESYYSAPWVMFAYNVVPYLYDMENGRFLVGGSWSSVLQTVSDPKLQNLNMDLNFMTRGYSPSRYYAYAVMKEKGSNGWHVYAMITQGNPAGCQLMADFDMTNAPEFTASKYYDFSTVSPLLYYASATGLYVCPFDLDSATPAIPSVASWTCPAGEEITYMRLFTESGVGLSESVANKLLIVGTWNGSEGKVYILKTDMASGVIDSTPVNTFGGFGKIGSIAFKRS